MLRNEGWLPPLKPKKYCVNVYKNVAGFYVGKPYEKGKKARDRHPEGAAYIYFETLEFEEEGEPISVSQPPELMRDYCIDIYIYEDGFEVMPPYLMGYRPDPELCAVKPYQIVTLTFQSDKAPIKKGFHGFV